MAGDIHATVYLVLQVLHITKIKCFQMVNFYMLLSNIHLSASPVLVLNRIIRLITSVLWYFLMNELNKLYLTKNKMVYQILH